MNLFRNIKTFLTILYIFFTNFTYIIHPQLMEYDKLMDPIKLCYIIDNINIIDENEDYQNIENAVEDDDEEDDDEEVDEEDDVEEDEEEDDEENDQEENDEEEDDVYEKDKEEHEQDIEKDDNIKVDEDDKKEDIKEDVKEEIDDKGEVNIKEECINVDSPILENNNNNNNNNEIMDIKDIQLLAENKEIKVEVPIKENKKKRKYIKKNHTEFKEFNKNIIQEFKNSN